MTHESLGNGTHSIYQIASMQTSWKKKDMVTPWRDGKKNLKEKKSKENIKY